MALGCPGDAEPPGARIFKFIVNGQRHGARLETQRFVGKATSV